MDGGRLVGNLGVCRMGIDWMLSGGWVSQTFTLEGNEGRDCRADLRSRLCVSF